MDYAGPCLDAEKFWFVVTGAGVVTLFLTLVLFLFKRGRETSLPHSKTLV